jgi:hypothetical protein
MRTRPQKKPRPQRVGFAGSNGPNRNTFLLLAEATRATHPAPFSSLDWQVKKFRLSARGGAPAGTFGGQNMQKGNGNQPLIASAGGGGSIAADPAGAQAFRPAGQDNSQRRQ